MKNGKVRVIQHGVKWVLNGEEPRCPDCFKLVRKPYEYELSNITKKHVNISIGRKVKWKCTECNCVFEYSRLFEKDDEYSKLFEEDK
jgi:hypothetical protein